jgi:serine/threonine protein kinase
MRYAHLLCVQVNPDSVALGPSIGEGAFSTVYAARYFGDVVAVKKQTRQGKDLEKYLLRELAVLKYIRHENMLEYIG